MTTLTELNDVDEVASLLARIEAGSRGATADRFRRLLERFDSEHRRVTDRRFGGDLQTEVVDLTQRRRGTKPADRRILA